MPKINRTPPSTPKPEEKSTTSSLNSAKVSETEFSSVTQRSKRHRSETSPPNELGEIREMLTKLSIDQETLKKCMSKITTELAELKSQNELLQKTKAEIERSATLISEKYEEIKLRMDKLEAERCEQRNYIDRLENQIQDMQKSHRPALIEIRNVLPRENENDKDLTTMFMGICQSLQIQMETTDLRDIYRIHHKQGPSRVIVAELHSVTKKNATLRAVRDFNKGKIPKEKLNSSHLRLPGETVPVYIADRLPASSRKLFFEARKFAKANDFQYCWSTNGKVFLRKKEGEKSIQIYSLHCFQNLLHA